MNVKHMIMLQDKMREIATNAREQRNPVKEAFEEVQGNIIEFMKSGDINVCNYQDEKLELQMVSRTGSLTKKTLEAGLSSYFNGDEAKTNECMEHIIASLGTRELDVLKRVKKRKPSAKKRSRARPQSPAPPVHNPVPPPIDAEITNEEVPEVVDSSDEE
jgi:hypothetical protein